MQKKEKMRKENNEYFLKKDVYSAFAFFGFIMFVLILSIFESVENNEDRVKLTGKSFPVDIEWNSITQHQKDSVILRYGKIKTRELLDIIYKWREINNYRSVNGRDLLDKLIEAKLISEDDVSEYYKEVIIDNESK
jgi:hypothetical protein